MSHEDDPSVDPQALLKALAHGLPPLTELEAEVGGVTFRVRNTGSRDPAKAEGTMALPDNSKPSLGRWLSPKDQKLFDACNGEFRSAEKICERAGLAYNQTHKGLLTNLKNRQILECDKQLGYRRCSKVGS